jgi:hypothetical protein
VFQQSKQFASVEDMSSVKSQLVIFNALLVFDELSFLLYFELKGLSFNFVLLNEFSWEDTFFDIWINCILHFDHL